jgi:hypothetical protein
MPHILGRGAMLCAPTKIIGKGVAKIAAIIAEAI